MAGTDCIGFGYINNFEKKLKKILPLTQKGYDLFFKPFSKF